MPPVACYSGTLAFVTTYMFMIGNHLPELTKSMGDDLEMEITEEKAAVVGLNGIHGDDKTAYMESPAEKPKYNGVVVRM